jgi:peptidyl-Asp metalloendopeptidase
VLGFTNGLVTKYGSASAANTRLANLMAITNQAYVNSSITPRVRLVRTVQVSYTDTNSNETALEAVTGFTCTSTGCTAQTVPTELVPLRTARDEYGGDLVSLVRPFQAPQHQGCGIAWLLGGGGFAIDNTDAPFGYSIVSDGSDVDEGDGRNYFCREETLAHELGHNMGQQHNIEDAGSPPDTGTHSYSYGYREGTTTGFYTVMAYRLGNSSQFSINYFGNPSVNYADTGRPTGTAAADNARSLNLSMPLVALFRNSVVPFGGRARNDFNGDGKSDIVLWNSSISYLAYWIMNGSVYTGSSGFTVASGFSPAATGFLTAIPQTSLLARNTTTQTLYSYIWNGTTHAQGTVGGTPAGWNLIGTGDIDGDGRGDLLWRNPTSGQFAYWLMNGAVYLGGQTYSPPVTYVVAGVADFNGDGRVDLLWNDPGTRNASVWTSTGTGFSVSQIGQYGTDWNMVGTADVTGDGKADIILRNNAKTYLAYWRMDGAVYQGAAAFGLATDRELFTTGDFDGDGIEDLVIARNSDRSLWLWRSNGSVFTESNIGQYGTDWTVIK